MAAHMCGMWSTDVGQTRGSRERACHAGWGAWISNFREGLLVLVGFGGDWGLWMWMWNVHVDVIVGCWLGRRQREPNPWATLGRATSWSCGQQGVTQR